MKTNNRRIWQSVCVAILIAVAYFMDRLDNMTANAVMQAFFLAIRNVIHISMIISWCVSLHRRILNVQVRRSIVATGLLMAFWLTAKAVKYEFVASRLFWLGRYIWYGYYIPMILIPLLGVFIIDHTGKPEDYRNPTWMKSLYIPAFVILIGIFTNDLHQMAFHFPQGIELFDSVYGYGPIYFAAMAWFVLLGIYFVVMLLRKSRVPGKRGIQSLPAVIMGGAVIFWTLYCFGIFRGSDLTVVDCLIIALLLESAVQSGLIPSNTNYHELFRASTIAAQIVNEDYQPCFMSVSATPLTEQEMKRAEQQPVRIGNSVLHAKPIKAGHVLWQDDVTQINEMMARMQDTQQQLGRQNELLQAELELKEQQAQAEEKNRLYDRIAEEVAPQLAKIEELLTLVGSESLHTHDAMARICTIGSYVKRRGNLLLLDEEARPVHAREIEYCIRESLDNLQLMSVYTMFEAQCEGELRLEHIIATYDFYESLVERLLDRITAMMIRLSCKNGSIKMNLQIGCVDDVSQQALEGLSLRFGSFTYTVQEEDIIIDFEISKGGICE